MYKIFPDVKQQKFRDGSFSFPKKFVAFFQDNLENVLVYLKDNWEYELGQEEKASLKFFMDKSLGEEAYKIKVDENSISIYSSTENGAYYGLVTLKQIYNQNSKEIRCLDLFDEPDLRIRGLMLDISRDKVPTVATIKHIIDMMSDVKMNHLQLYVEGFSFEYKSFPEYLKENNYITVEEYKEVEKYANSKMIDLVPNQNGFGHMAKWLATDEYKDLAEVPEGIFLWGRHRSPSTLNPLDPRSLELVKKMYADMLPHSNSKYFNMNFDEPFELGKGKSKEEVEKHGLGQVYLDFVLKVYDEIKKYDKQPFIWGDVLINHPEVLPKLPKDMLFIDWGYDAVYPFKRNLKRLSDLDIKFLAAPATTSWCSFLGRTDDWWENIQNAAVYTEAFGGEGLIVTVWGDFGHLQFLPISYAPLIFTGLMSWRVKEGTFFRLPDYLNKYVYKDTKNVMANTVLELGNYYRYYNDYRSNGTTAFHTFMWANYGIKEDNPYEYYYTRMKRATLSLENYQLMNQFLDLKLAQLELTNLEVAEGDLMKAELKHSVYLVKLINDLNYSFNEELDKATKIKLLEGIVSSKDYLIEEQKRLWLSRNKYSDLDYSISYLDKFIEFTDKILSYHKEVE